MSERGGKIKSYPLTPVQKVDLYQTLMGIFHRESGNVPISVIYEKDMDLGLLREALKIEISRNDSMRIRLRFTLKGVRQSFPAEKDLGEIPFDDLLGKTEEEFDTYVRELNAKPVKTFRGEPYRLRFFRAPDGRYGIYGTFAHVAMDAGGVMLFYCNVANIYKALRDGEELPPPMARFEDMIQKDIELFANKERMERTVRFYEEYFTETAPGFFAGVDKMRDLKKTREKKRKPDFRGVETVHPLNDKSRTVKCHIDRDMMEKIEAFCAEHRVSVQSVFQMGMRTHLSKVNENCENVSMFMTVGRRATVADKNSGGSRALAHVVRASFGAETTFAQALKQLDRCNLRIYKHSEYSSVDEIYHLSRVDGLSPMYTTLPVLFTFFPKGRVPVPKGIDCEYYGSGNGHFVYAEYTMFVPNLRKGGYDCYYEYQTRSITREDVLLMHENLVKTVCAGMENPDITVGEIMEKVL